MTLMLYHHPVSTCSQKVRLALAEKGLSFDQHIINWSIIEHLSDWYLKINPNGVVPALVHDGHPIIDSSVICEYIDEAFGERQVSPDDPLARAEMRAWMRYFEEVPTVSIRFPSFNKLFVKALKKDRTPAEFDEMTDKMPLRQHFYKQMGDKGFSDQAVSDSLDRLRKCLVRVSERLDDGREYLIGQHYSIADIVLVPSVVRMEDLGLGHLWGDLPNIEGWFNRVKERPSFNIAYMEGARVNPESYTIEQGYASRSAA